MSDSYSMQQNINTLDWLSRNTSDGKLRNRINGKVDFKLQVGEIYAFKTKDDPNYYKTIILKRIGMDNVVRPIISEFPTYGDIPPHIQEIEPEQVIKYMSHLNLNVLRAYPFRGMGINHLTLR